MMLDYYRSNKDMLISYDKKRWDFSKEKLTADEKDERRFYF